MHIVLIKVLRMNYTSSWIKLTSISSAILNRSSWLVAHWSGRYFLIYRSLHINRTRAILPTMTTDHPSPKESINFAVFSHSVCKECLCARHREVHDGKIYVTSVVPSATTLGLVKIQICHNPMTKGKMYDLYPAPVDIHRWPLAFSALSTSGSLYWGRRSGHPDDPQPINTRVIYNSR